MKKLITLVSFYAGYLFSFIFPSVLFKVLRIASNSLKSGFIKKKFKHSGFNLKIDFPFYSVGLKHIQIGNNFSAFAGLRLEAHDLHLGYKFEPELYIGDNVSINYDCHIGCINKIIIGNNVLIASKVFITDHFHGGTDLLSLKTPPSKRKVVSKGPVIICDNVWIGEGVAIMPGITIGENCIIGANAVVTKSFPGNTVIGGNPAKIIKNIS